MVTKIYGNGIIDTENFDVDASGNITSPTTTALQNVIKTDRIAVPSNSTNPSTSNIGDMYYNTTYNALYIKSNEGWQKVVEPTRPSAIASQTLWIDMSDQSTVSGVNVTDLSGNGRNAQIITASTGNSNSPTTSTSWYGTLTSPPTGYVNALDSSGALHHSQNELPNYNGVAYTFWMLHTSETATGHDSWINMQEGWTSNYQIIRTNSNLVDWNFYNNSGGSTSPTGSGGVIKSVTGDAWQIYTFVFNGSNGCTIYRRVNGIEYSQSVTTPGGDWRWNAGPVVVGNSPWSHTSEAVGGKIAAYGMYSKQLDSFDRNILYTYYNSKGFNL